MSHTNPGSVTSEKLDDGSEFAWIRPGATFTDDGAPNRIAKVQSNRVHGVSADSTWCWSWPGFVEAVRALLASAETNRDVEEEIQAETPPEESDADGEGREA